MSFVPNTSGDYFSNIYSGGSKPYSGGKNTKKSDGLYHVGNKTYKHLVGTRRVVYNENAHHTSGGLVKSDLLLNKHHRIVSKKKHFTAKREKNLEKHGYFTKKGVFGFVRKTRSRK